MVQYRLHQVVGIGAFEGVPVDGGRDGQGLQTAHDHREHHAALHALQPGDLELCLPVGRHALDMHLDHRSLPVSQAIHAVRDPLMSTGRIYSIPDSMQIRDGQAGRK